MIGMRITTGCFWHELPCIRVYDATSRRSINLTSMRIDHRLRRIRGSMSLLGRWARRLRVRRQPREWLTRLALL